MGYGWGIVLLIAIAYMPMFMRIHRRLDRLEERLDKMERQVNRSNGNTLP